jgi:rubrerythrin
MKMAMKMVFVMILGCWLVFQSTQAAPSYERNANGFEDATAVDLAKRLLEEERAWLNRLTENEKRASPSRACSGNSHYDPDLMECVRYG